MEKSRKFVPAWNVASALIYCEVDYLSSSTPRLTVELCGVGMLPLTVLWKGLGHGQLPPRKDAVVFLPSKEEVVYELRLSRDTIAPSTSGRELRSTVVAAIARLEAALSGEVFATK